LGLLENGGGDKIQVENTAAELRKLGVEIDIKSGLNTDMAGYDLIHIFQLDWSPESYFYTKQAKELGKPIVLSPIHHSVAELKKFDEEYVFDYRRLTKYMFRNQFHRDTYKDVYRTIFDPVHLKPTIYSIFKGLQNMNRDTIRWSDYVLVQTEKEAEDLKTTYEVDFKWSIVPNGVSKNFINNSHYQNALGINEYILCVGRIEPRKNQLSVIEAVKRLRKETGLDLKLVLVGVKSSRKHVEYILRFNSSLKKNKWVIHISKVPYEEMPSYCHFAKVGVSASWFETTGLTSLEALFSGTNAVASGERAKEYLGDQASYCKPEDIDSIKDAIKKEYFAPRPVVTDKMLSSYTWENAAKKTFEVYNQVLKKEVTL